MTNYKQKRHTEKQTEKKTELQIKLNKGDTMVKRTSYNYLNNLNNKKGVLVISRYLKRERGIINFTCGKEFLMFDKSLSDTKVIDNLYIYENIDTKTKDIK